MQVRLWWLWALCVVGVGCTVPRGGLLMMGADRVGSGGAEVGLGAGIGYSATTQNTGTASSSSGTLQIPLLEANARIGLTDMIDVNLHAGATGISPGLKIGFGVAGVEVAAMPNFGIGLYRVNQTTSFGTTSSGNAYMLFNVEAGLRLMASLEMGGFFGVGYWFQYSNYATEPASTTPGTTSGNVTGHNIGFNLGWTFAAGALRIRPEIGFVMLVGASTSSGGMSSNASSPTFTVMPAVTLAAGTEKKK